MDINKLKALALVEDKNNFDTMLNHVANGGSLINLCQMWEARYSDVIRAIRANPELEARYDQALEDRKEWAKERVLSEFKAISTFSIKDLFDPVTGAPIPIHELPDEVAAAIREVDAEGSVKMVDKLKALDLLNKNMAGVVDKTEINGKLTLEQAIMQARQIKESNGDSDPSSSN
jgi:hypothetical protein